MIHKQSKKEKIIFLDFSLAFALTSKLKKKKKYRIGKAQDLQIMFKNITVFGLLVILLLLCEFRMYPSVPLTSLYCSGVKKKRVTSDAAWRHLHLLWSKRQGTKSH